MSFRQVEANCGTTKKLQRGFQSSADASKALSTYDLHPLQKYYCRICKKTFSNERTYSADALKHTAKVYTCSVENCRAQLSTPDSARLRIHYLNCHLHPEKMLTCGVLGCRMVFGTEYCLEDHRTNAEHPTLSDEESRLCPANKKCDPCNRYFSSPRLCGKHRSNCVEERKISYPQQRFRPMPIEGWSGKCPFDGCPEFIRCMEELSIHVSERHDDLITARGKRHSSSSEVPSLRCLRCRHSVPLLQGLGHPSKCLAYKFPDTLGNLLAEGTSDKTHDGFRWSFALDSSNAPLSDKRVLLGALKDIEEIADDLPLLTAKVTSFYSDSAVESFLRPNVSLGGTRQLVYLAICGVPGENVTFKELLRGGRIKYVGSTGQDSLQMRAGSHSRDSVEKWARRDPTLKPDERYFVVAVHADLQDLSFVDGLHNSDMRRLESMLVTALDARSLFNIEPPLCPSTLCNDERFHELQAAITEIAAVFLYGTWQRYLASGLREDGINVFQLKSPHVEFNEAHFSSDGYRKDSSDDARPSSSESAELSSGYRESENVSTGILSSQELTDWWLLQCERRNENPLKAASKLVSSVAARLSLPSTSKAAKPGSPSHGMQFHSLDEVTSDCAPPDKNTSSAKFAPAAAVATVQGPTTVPIITLSEDAASAPKRAKISYKLSQGSHSAHAAKVEQQIKQPWLMLRTSSEDYHQSTSDNYRMHPTAPVNPQCAAARTALQKRASIESRSDGSDSDSPL